MYLEHYLDSVENLPLEVQRNFTLMRDLDQRTQDLFAEINKMSEQYITSVKSMTASQRNKHLTDIQNAYSKSREFADDKVQLAVQTYELVDKHIRRLDSDLSRFETELRKKESEQGSSEGKGSSKDGTARGKRKSTSDVQTARKRTKGSEDGASMASSVPTAAEVLDMPVDPNEPTYCLCHQVSYGEMIGCDNPDCPIEWFHFACVGLTSKPKGKWFCPRCSQDRKKK